MPWGPPVLGTRLTSGMALVATTIPTNVALGASLSSSPTVDQLLQAPFVKGLLELNSQKEFVAAGTSPEFPIGPKWRKVVRQIG